MNRELTVSLLAGFLLTFTAWTWGGVVLWTQWVVAGTGLLALAVALLPDPKATGRSVMISARILAIALGLGALTAAILTWNDLGLLLAQRESTLQLLPAAQLEPLRFVHWGLRGLLAGVVVSLVSLIGGALFRQSEVRHRLIRFLPFWLGLLLFAWIACQSLNTWGVVVQRDLFWRILPRDHIAWLPSGLGSPFHSDEAPGGMNGWRQLLIFVGPWALLCALVASQPSRRTYAWLAIGGCLNGLGVALAGNVAVAQKWTGFLGLDDPDLGASPFGPFIYKNHAGAYLYLAAAATLGLMFYLAKRRGDKVDRGGPHLVAALAAIFLILGSASTMSIGALFGAGILLLIVGPIAYLCDRRLREMLSPIPAASIVILVAVVAYAGMLSTDAKKWRYRIDQKQQTLARAGTDDRAPLRQATWAMVGSAELSRQISGWGAGSYRWISPAFLRDKKEFLNRRGELKARVTHAHNDWLQACAEWGLAGWVVMAGTLAFLAQRVRAQVLRPRAPAIVLLGGLVLFSGHAFFDFLLFIPLLTLSAILVAWLLTLEAAESAPLR